jgi:hypothetical protein
LPYQPFFYPVLSEEYATQIARDWNTKDAASGFTGYVLRFNVLADFWISTRSTSLVILVTVSTGIPVADLDQLNQNIVGTIEVLAVYKGN